MNYFAIRMKQKFDESIHFRNSRHLAVFARKFEFDEVTEGGSTSTAHIFASQNMEHPRTSYNCPACQATLSVKTKLRPHLERHCSAIQCLPPKEAWEKVLYHIQGLSEELRQRRTRMCNCDMNKTHFCKRLIPLIDWHQPVVMVQVPGNATRTVDYFRYVLLLCMCACL